MVVVTVTVVVVVVVVEVVVVAVAVVVVEVEAVDMVVIVIVVVVVRKGPTSRPWWYYSRVGAKGRVFISKQNKILIPPKYHILFVTDVQQIRRISTCKMPSWTSQERYRFARVC